MATEKILIFDEAGNAKRMKVRIARFLDNEPVTSSDKENIRTTLEVDGSQSGTFTTPLSVTSASDSSFTGGGNVTVSSGDVIITGDTSDAYTAGTLKLTAGNLGTNSIQLGDVSDADIGMIQYANSDNSMRLTTNGSERWRIDSSGNLVANGTGIDFSSTGDGSGSGQAEILSDFETGQWSPQFYSSGGTLTATMDVRSARYVKVGHMVTVMCYIRTSNVDNSSASGSLRISGLPYAVAGSNNYTAAYVGHAIGWATAPAGGYTENSGSNIIVNKRASIGGNLSAMSPSDLTNGSGTYNEMMLTATYCSF